MIVSGTVAVYSSDGIEVAHLHDKNTFGELLFHHNNVSSMNKLKEFHQILFIQF